MADYENDLNEQDTKMRYITPAIKAAGWKDHQIKLEKITKGRVLVDMGGCTRDGSSRKFADYFLRTDGGIGLAVVEAKSIDNPVSQGLQQAIEYALLLDVPFAYSSNGLGFREHNMITGEERDIDMGEFPSEQELWNKFTELKQLPKESILNKPYYYDPVDEITPRYYQRVAINRIHEAIVRGQKRILAVMATGTGKTFVAMQVIHKIHASEPNAKILFLVDRNGLIDHTRDTDFKHFKSFMTKIEHRSPDSAYTLHLSLYHQLVNEKGKTNPYEYFKPEYFDYIIVDECHRGSAKDNSEWRSILNHFKDAVQIGLTATPREDNDVSTSNYFGEAVYTYSYKQGVDDGYLAPFIVIDDSTTIDDYWMPSENNTDEQGNPLRGPFDRRDYDRRVIVEDRIRIVSKRVVEWLKLNGVYSRTIIFCESQEEALTVRDMIAELMPEEMAKNPDYVVRITSDDPVGMTKLESFMRKDTTYPVIATTSELLTTGYDVFMTKLIVIDKIISSPTVFKQIIGRGSRLDTDLGKWYFTLMDFRNSTRLLEGDWDGVPEPYDPPRDRPKVPKQGGGDPGEPPYGFGKVRVKGHVDVEIEREIVRIYGPSGMTTENLIDFSKGRMLDCYPDLKDFLSVWNSERKKETVRNMLEENGILITEIRERMNRPDLDDFDILLELAYKQKPLTKTERADRVMNDPELQKYTGAAREIIECIMDKYCSESQNDISDNGLLRLPEFSKFGTIPEIVELFGGKKGYENTIDYIQSILYC